LRETATANEFVRGWKFRPRVSAAGKRGREMVDVEAALFKSIAELIHEQRTTSGRDRRENPRHPYPCIQLIAPFDGEHLPEQSDFQQVMCHDLSPHGFSFRSTHAPRMQQLIVALGKVPFKFLVAEVVRTTPVVTEQDGEFQIGCRFLSRIA
jgi:hypothetical protein